MHVGNAVAVMAPGVDMQGAKLPLSCQLQVGGQHAHQVADIACLYFWANVLGPPDKCSAMLDPFWETCHCFLPVSELHSLFGPFALQRQSDTRTQSGRRRT